MAEAAKQAAEVQIIVTFPVSKKGPFKEDFFSEDAVATVRTAAMTHFEVVDDAQFTYVLAHGGKPQDGGATLGSVFGPAKAGQFRLIKVITQG